MGEVYFCKTDDGSVGLFNKCVDDIYHSTHGAYSESYEKFLLSSGFLDFIKNHDKVSILDVCYGIGYNSKTALDEILKLNKTLNVKIDALEYDENLIFISPLLNKQLIDNSINKFLIDNSNFNFEKNIFDVFKIFYNLKGFKYLNWRNLVYFCTKITKRRGKCILSDDLNAFPHNIYYDYIPFRFKNREKTNRLAKTTFSFHSDDARNSVLKLNHQYNFIFLDAFTPKKLPTLWSFEFFKELYRLLDDDGVLVTYSSSAAVRSAMIEAGFFIGCSLDKNNKRIGTIATKNKLLIKNDLSEFDLELLKTKAGIFYRDKNLSASKDEITALREKEVEESNRMTSSRLKKIYAKK